MESEVRWNRRDVSVAVLSATLIGVVVLAGVAVTSSTGWSAIEMSALRQISLGHSLTLDRTALGLNWFFGPHVGAVLVALSAACILLTTRRLRTTVYFLALVLPVWFGNETIKEVVHRPRPDIQSLPHALVLEPGGLSFPSGHTSFTACLMLGLIMVTWTQRWRRLSIVIAIVLVLATAWSRVYLGVHYPSDVAASIVYAVAGVALANSLWSLLVVPHWRERRPVVDTVHSHDGRVPDAR
jgi:undecaprenyl-diphosphatase